MIPLRMALAESRNAVAIWIAEQIGIARVLETARDLGIRDAVAPVRHNGLGRVRSELAGACQCLPHDRIRHSQPAAGNPEDRGRFG